MLSHTHGLDHERFAITKANLGRTQIGAFDCIGTRATEDAAMTDIAVNEVGDAARRTRASRAAPS